MSSTSKASSEESGWTTYFEDFFNNNNNNDYANNNHNYSSLSLSGVASSSSSLLSDATSLLHNNQHVQIQNVFSFNQITDSNLKKRKNIVDQALEDTATSLLNSPKEKDNTSGQKELCLNGKDSDCTELKKRGLCV
uniref:Uncharacterized protein n=1 Tax=Cicer arietinum TaxID=3827 RepID=A0A1S2YIV2_CICAR|nr:vascular-related unknown protein 1-like [Cicer arietinum]